MGFNEANEWFDEAEFWTYMQNTYNYNVVDAWEMYCMGKEL